MSSTIAIKALEDLLPFRNEKGILEIALRGNKKRFRAFQKVMINNLPEAKEETLAEKVINALNKNTMLGQHNLKLLENVAKVQNISLLLNGLNLCATCAGFAIMYKKLDNMSAEINQQLYQIQKRVNQTQDIQNDFEFNKVLSEHTNMLDCQKRHQPYSEEKMRELVDLEHNVLSLLLNSLEKDVSDDHGNLIFSAFSLLSMFTVSLCIYDEIYYENHHEILKGNDIWHASHDRWTNVFDRMLSDKFIEVIQDYAVFKTSFNTLGVDVYCTNLIEQVKELKEEVTDNQELIIAIGNGDLFRQYKEMNSIEISEAIKNAFIDAGEGLEEETVMAAYNSAMKQAALA